MSNVVTKGKYWWDRNRSDPVPIKTNFSDFVQREYFEHQNMPDEKHQPSYRKQVSALVGADLTPREFDSDICEICGGKGMTYSEEVNKTRTHFFQYITCPNIKNHREVNR